MEISASNQAFVFLAMVVCGFACGFVFDFFRAIRRFKSSGKRIVATQDILFWLAELVIVYEVLFKLNYARIRLYEAIALVLGSFLYFMTVSHYAISMMCTLVGWSAKLIIAVFLPLYRLVLKTLTPLVKAKNSIVCKIKSFKIHLVTRMRNITQKITLGKKQVVQKASHLFKKTTKKDN